MRNFKIPSREHIKSLEARYPAGTRVELIHMDDPYATYLHAGDTGTITGIDSLGDLMVSWDSGSSLKLILGVDCFRVIKDSSVN